MPLRPHRWDEIRDTETVIDSVFLTQMIDGGTTGIHESMLRAYRILAEVKDMLGRGDSPETIMQFIRWAEKLSRDE